MTTTTQHGTSIGAGEILSTGQLRSEAAAAEAVLEEFIALSERIGQWIRALPERYTAAPFGTTELTTAVTALTDALSSGQEITEGLGQLLAALEQADALGEQVTAHQADGQVAAFTTR